MKVQNGQNVQVHYKGTLKDGTVFDDSYRRGTAVEFQVGSKQLLRGFSNTVVGMQVGEKRSVTLAPDDAYGTRDPMLLRTVPKTEFGPDFEFIEGGTVQGTGPTGQPFLAKFEEVRDEDVVLDLNHPLAGEELTFEIELMGVESDGADWNPKMKKAELYEVAKGMGLPVTTKHTKAQLVEALSA
tara:strand:+ start:501 stop:1052 length:552 start_codon:yes stop_codon:yes gene_type:complete